VSTFALPDLRSRIPVGVSTNTQWGETGGLEQVSLSPNELPNHSHPFMASQAAATAGIPNGNTVADVSPTLMYRGAANANLVALGPSAIEGVGQSLPHENRMPFLVITYVIAIQGIFPPRG
jgi:microcystin-dependent protein